MCKKIGLLSLCMALLVVCALWVQAAEPPVVYDPASEGVVSGYYQVDQQQNYITGIGPETPAKLLGQVCLPQCQVEADSILATGTQIPFSNGQTMTAIVTGDMNGDGIVSISDLLMAKSYILGSDLAPTALAAGDLNRDGQVSVTDFLKLKAYLLGMEEIRATAPEDTALLLGVGDRQQLPQGRYSSGDPAVFTVDPEGNITALSPGTAFLYTCDDQGQILCRQLVTVVEEPLQLAFPHTDFILTQEQTLAIPYTCNHPIAPQIRWESADPSVVLVTDGILQAQALGQTQVHATLPDGSLYTFQVKVAGAVSDWLDIGQHRYYFDENGEMYHGWLELDGDTYYLKENGVMAIGQITLDGINYFFTSTGKHVLMPNPQNAIPENYQVDLVKVGYVEVAAECAGALQDMINAGKKAGYHLNVSSGYRSMAVQQFLWNKDVQYFMGLGYSKADAEAKTGLSVAIPGHSEHQLGLAADISKGNEPVLKWIRENCWDYGFILRYPTGKTEYTGIMYEPWHFRYVGLELAAELKELGICMEEYMEMLTKQEQEKDPPPLN